MEHEYYSDAVVDFSGFGKTIGDLQSSFSLLEFLDYCAIMEGLVLHDRLIVVGANNGLDKWKEFLKPLEANGILVIPKDKTPVAAPGGRPDQFQNERDYNIDSLNKRHMSHKIARSTHLDSWYEVGRLLGAEAQFGCTSLSLIRQRPYYEKYSQAKPQHTVTNLSARYRELSDTLLEIRKQNRLMYESFMFVPIPPVPLMALKRSNSFEEVLTRTLEIRDDFNELRASLRNLRADLYDETIPPLKKKNIIQKWQKSWHTLQSYKESSSYVEIGNKALDVPDLNKAIDDLGIDTVKLTSLLKVMVAVSSKAFYRWRVRILHEIAKKYLKTSDSELNHQIKRLFGASIEIHDIHELERWLSVKKG